MSPRHIPPIDVPPAEASTFLTVVSMTASGTVDDYSGGVREQILSKFAQEAGVARTRVSIEVTAASVNIVLSIKSDTKAAAEAVKVTLANSIKTAEGATAFLPDGFTVETIPVINVSKATEESLKSGNNETIHREDTMEASPHMLVALIGGATALLVVSLIACQWRRRQLQRRSSSAVGKSSELPRISESTANHPGGSAIESGERVDMPPDEASSETKFRRSLSGLMSHEQQRSHRHLFHGSPDEAANRMPQPSRLPPPSRRQQKAGVTTVPRRGSTVVVTTRAFGPSIIASSNLAVEESPCNQPSESVASLSTVARLQLKRRQETIDRLGTVAPRERRHSECGSDETGGMRSRPQKLRASSERGPDSQPPSLRAVLGREDAVADVRV